MWIYSDKDSGKNRPCVVVGNSNEVKDVDMVVAKMTTHEVRDKFDFNIENWKEIGLIKPSIVRCSKLFTIKAIHLKFRVAKIEGEDLETIKKTIAEYILE